METTLREAVKCTPCLLAIPKLMSELGYDCDRVDWKGKYNSLTNNQKDSPIDFKFILEHCGVVDAFLLLETQDDKIRAPILLDVMWAVTSSSENAHLNRPTVECALNTIKRCCNGEIEKNELREDRDVLYIVEKSVYDENQWKRNEAILKSYL